MTDNSTQFASIFNDDQNLSRKASENENTIEMSDDEKIDFVAARILEKYRAAFEELAK